MTQSAPAPGEGGTLEEVLRRASGRDIDIDEESRYSRAEEGRSGVRNDVAAEHGDDSDSDVSDDHGQCRPGSQAVKKSGGHGHGHGHGQGSMNMQAVLLHVIGDALGNVGVIATGLIIWLTTWKYKYYCDPVISLVITVIIFSSALPLGKHQRAIGRGRSMLKLSQCDQHPLSYSKASPHQSLWKTSTPLSRGYLASSLFTSSTSGNSQKARSLHLCMF